MNSSEKRFDITSADNKIIGFDYQYYFFVNKLLTLKDGQTIGFEAKDDVHTDIIINGRTWTTLYQLKHTIQNNSTGNPINLTDLDIDLWKSLSNWVKVIFDGNRSTLKSQREFLKNTEFIFATNKSIANCNVISLLTNFKNGEIKLSVVKKHIENLNTKDKTIKGYIEEFLILNNTVLKEFILKLTFVDTGNDIIESIKKNIWYYLIPDTKVNDVFNNLYSELKQLFFNDVKNGRHQILTYPEWRKISEPIFTKHKSPNLSIQKYNYSMPNNLFEQSFIKELVEIGEIDIEDLAEASEFTTFMLEVQDNINKWYNDGDITLSDIQDLHNNSKTVWKNAHKASHRNTKSTPESENENALKCLDLSREKEFHMLDTKLGVELSNGEFYYLSNEKEIGWKSKWKEIYNNVNKFIPK